MSEIFASLQKNSLEEIRFCFTEWNGRKYIDIRVWIPADPEQDRKEIPTRKGVRFDVELLPDFLKILRRIDKKMTGEGD